MHENVKVLYNEMIRKFPSWRDISHSFGQFTRLPFPEELSKLVSCKIKSPDFSGLSLLAAQL